MFSLHINLKLILGFICSTIFNDLELDVYLIVLSFKKTIIIYFSIYLSNVFIYSHYSITVKITSYIFVLTPLYILFSSCCIISLQYPIHSRLGCRKTISLSSFALNFILSTQLVRKNLHLF